MTAIANIDLQSRREAAIPRGVATMLPVFAASAEGADPLSHQASARQ
jgi:4-aminobutyrate aminotransferase / (S)-3-amino-2-methylpropionate transaminase / 5-aminovalerate transaminase